MATSCRAPKTKRASGSTPTSQARFGSNHRPSAHASLPPPVLTLCLCARTVTGAVLDALSPVLTVFRASALSDKQPPARLARTPSVPGLLHDVVEKLKAT